MCYSNRIKRIGEVTFEVTIVEMFIDYFDTIHGAIDNYYCRRKLDLFYSTVESIQTRFRYRFVIRSA